MEMISIPPERLVIGLLATISVVWLIAFRAGRIYQAHQQAEIEKKSNEIMHQLEKDLYL